jgi:hypothetical protein
VLRDILMLANLISLFLCGAGVMCTCRLADVRCQFDQHFFIFSLVFEPVSRK